MLPACRTAGEPFAVPQFSLTRSDIDSFMDELRGFHTAFRACFARQEPRDQFFNYMVGQFSALARKSIEPMALQVEGGKVRAMQRLVSDALWDEAAMRETYHRLVRNEMGEPDGVLIVDETGFVKKGQDSVGVARQYCGALGKVENCQVGVFAAYASRQGYALVDKRLFIPEPWFTEAYQARRTKCKLPDEVGWQSKPQLAAAMVQELHQAGVLPFKYIVADCLYGNSPDFWEACEACVGTVAFVATPADTRCWLQPLATTTHTYTYKGESRTQRRATASAPAPGTVAALGDFSKRISFIMMWRPAESEYPSWATQGGVPVGFPPPASPACSGSPLFGRPSDGVPRAGECPSTSYFWPLPPSSPHRPTSSRSSAIPECPSIAQWDYIYYDRAGNTGAESVCQWHRRTSPCAAKIACVSHCFLGHYPF